MKMKNNFYDTSSLLLRCDDLFNDDEHLFISSVTLKELERIKTAANKDYNVKYNARQLLHALHENSECVTYIIFQEYMLEPITARSLDVSDDMRILASAYHLYDIIDKFYTNDLSLYTISKLFFPEDKLEMIKEIEDDYTGYVNVIMSEDEMSEFYSNLNSGIYNEKLQLLTNQYLNILDKEGNIVDTYRWNGELFVKLKYSTLESNWLGKIKPLQDDKYQSMAVDSFLNNKITMLKGPAGTGKSQLSVAFLMHLLDRNKIDKIIIFCNPVATRNSARLGFYPGSKNDKLLDSQTGNFLTAKLGGRLAVEQLINEEKLVLLPFSDIRGYDTSGMNAGIYITEAQNLDISLLKLALQRVGEDSICIVEGDEKTQVDLIDYEGFNNGMRRMSQVFRGQDIYGEVTLQKIHRSRIAEIAQRL